MKQYRILIDGAIFYLQREKPAGISRVWSALLYELEKSSLSKNILLLDRAGTLPKIKGLSSRPGRPYFYDQFAEEPQYLERICTEEDTDLFISTYYTYASRTPSVIMLHDMIPEVLGWDLNELQWITKRRAIEKAIACFSVSHNTTTDFRRMYPAQHAKPVYSIPNAASPVFTQKSPEEVRRFRRQQGIAKPYYLFCGHRWPNKNALLFFNGFALLPDKNKYEILLTGGSSNLEPEFVPFMNGSEYKIRYLSEKELAAAYSGAVSLVYPSLYEGFGMPVVEAMQCGCPVICCRNSAVAEVAGDAALFVSERDVVAMRNAMQEIRSPQRRSELIFRGRQKAQSYSWSKTGSKLTAAIQEICAGLPEKSSSHVAVSAGDNEFLVTAVVSTYNAAHFITGCLNDLLAQTIARRLEIIIVDSASEQDERELVKPYLDRCDNIRYIRTPKRESLYAAWNRGIRAARGRYITNANTDDRRRPDALEVLVQTLESDSGFDLAYGDCYVSTIANEIYEHNNKTRLLRYPEFFAPSSLLHYQFGPQPLWRKQLHDKIGYFDESLKAAGDYDFNLRFCLQAAAVHVSEPLGLYLKHDDAISFQDDTMAHENQRLRSVWHSLERIVALYRMAGIPCETPAAQAQVYADMGLRALAYYPPWREGGSENNLDLALMCFDAASLSAPSWKAPYQNIAALLQRLGKQHDLHTLRAALASKGMHLPETDTIPYVPSGLSVPSQYELSFPVSGKSKTFSVSNSEKKKRHVLISCDFFHPSVGGTELFVEELGVRLQECGFTVDIACRRLANRTEHLYRGMHIHEFTCEGNLLMGVRGSDLDAYKRLLSDDRYDAVIVFAHPDNWNVVAAAQVPRPCPKMIFMPSINARNISEWNRARINEKVAAVLKTADRVISVTESGYDEHFLSQHGIEHYFIPHAVAPVASEQNFRDRFGLSHAEPLLVVVANFWPVKNQLELLEIMSKAKENRQLVLIGHSIPYPVEQEYYKKVVQSAAADPRTSIFEGLSPADADAAIRDADVLLLPSKGESAGPLVILQAMHHGTPWVATPACNAVEDEAGGLVTDPDGFPHAVEQLLHHSETAKQMGRLGHRHWRERFSWEKMLPAYQDVIAGDRKPPDFRMPADIREENTRLQKRLLSGSIARKQALPKLSVIIPTFNRCEVLRRCLDALSWQTLPPDQFEVIVCNDGSTDETASMVKNFNAEFHLFCISQENSGPAAARNRGIEKARGELVMFLNDDAILDPNALLVHIQTHQDNDNRKIAVLGTFTLHPEFNDLEKPLGCLLEHSDIIFDYPFMEQDRLYDYTCFYTCNISLPRTAVIDAGLFDEGFPYAGAEDVEMGYRLQKSGFLTLYRPDCIALHAHRLDVDGLRSMFVTRGKGGVLAFIRHEELFTHYGDISQETIARWTESESNIENKVRELEKEIGSIDTVFSAHVDTYPTRTFSEKTSLVFFKNLWKLSEQDLLNMIDRLCSEIRNLKTKVGTELHRWMLFRIGKELYPAVNFLKWYYDTLGVVQSPWIYEFIEVRDGRKQKKGRETLYLPGSCSEPFRFVFRQKVREGNEHWRDMMRSAETLLHQAMSEKTHDPSLLPEAVTSLEKALVQKPYDPAGLSLLHTVYTAQNKKSLAARLSEKMHFLSHECDGKKDVEGKRRKAFERLHHNDRQGALLLFSELYQMCPRLQEPALELMDFCMRHDLLAEAHELPRSLTECYNGNNPFGYAVYYQMGRLAFVRGDYDRAAEFCMKSIRSCMYTPSLNLLAEIHVRRGNLTEAIKYWGSSLQVDALQIPVYLKLYEKVTACFSSSGCSAENPVAAIIRSYDVYKTIRFIEELCSADIPVTSILVSCPLDGARSALPDRIGKMMVEKIPPCPANSLEKMAEWLQTILPKVSEDNVAFLDDNLTLPHDWFFQSNAVFDRYPQAVATGAKVVIDAARPNKLHTVYQFLDTVTDSGVKLTSSRRNDIDLGQHDFVRTCAAVSDSCVLFRKNALHEICNKGLNMKDKLPLMNAGLGMLPSIFNYEVVYNGLTDVRYDAGRAREVTPLHILYPNDDTFTLRPSQNYQPQDMVNIKTRIEERDCEDIGKKIAALKDMNILPKEHRLPFNIL